MQNQIGIILLHFSLRVFVIYNKFLCYFKRFVFLLEHTARGSDVSFSSFLFYFSVMLPLMPSESDCSSTRGFSTHAIFGIAP